jgi:hypothetical protein
MLEEAMMDFNEHLLSELDRKETILLEEKERKRRLEEELQRGGEYPPNTDQHVAVQVIHLYVNGRGKELISIFRKNS